MTQNKPPRRTDLTGQRFSRWLVIRFSHIEQPRRAAHWLCQCDCGTKRIVRAQQLISGQSKSCGCLKVEIFVANTTKHGHSSSIFPKGRSSEYLAWQSMKDRCTNPNNKQFKDYGGRGIKVCKRWHNSFEAFLADMGMKPSPEHSLDRYPNNDGNYEPKNCRWATWKQQASNKRRRERNAL